MSRSPLTYTQSSHSSVEQPVVVGLYDLAPTRKKLILLSLGINSALICMCLTILLPVFPIELKRMFPSRAHGVIVGAVLSVATISDFLFTPFAAREVGVLGPRRILLLGSILVSGVSFLFAFVCRVYDWSSFLALCFSLRIAQGAGTAMMTTSVFAVAAGMFPDQVSTMSGLLKLCMGVGLVIGPGIGGVLYDYAGFGTPFMTSGIMVLVGFFIMWYFLPETGCGTPETDEKISFMTLLRIPRIALLVVGNILCITMLSFFDPTLGPYLHRRFGFSPSKVGGVFLLLGAVNAILSPIAGFIVDEYSSSQYIIPFGALLLAVGCELIGPWYLFSTTPTIKLILAGVALIGLGSCLVLIPTVADILNTMRDRGYGDSLMLHSTIGGVFAALLSLGWTAGPLLGGMLTEEYNFNDPVSVMGIVLFTYSLILVLQTIHLMDRLRKLCQKQERTIGGELYERTRLI